MTIALFDVQAGFGGANRGETHVITADECLAMMARLEIGRALVRTDPDTLDVDPCRSNDLLFQACREQAMLVPCPVALPATAYDLPSEAEQIDRFIRGRAGAAAIRPKTDDWTLAPFVSDRLFRAMAERRLPLYCLAAQLSFTEVADIAGRFPALPLILSQVAYRSQRTIIPLLETFRNVHLSLGNNWTVHRGLEQMVEKIGPAQLLFGTGFPAAEPMMAVTQLMYAEIGDEAKVQIGALNLERLLGEIN